MIGASAPRELKVLEQLGTFEAITVWRHEAAPEDTEDQYLKAISEWIRFAAAIHDDEPNADNATSPAKDVTNS